MSRGAGLLRSRRKSPLVAEQLERLSQRLVAELLQSCLGGSHLVRHHGTPVWRLSHSFIIGLSAIRDCLLLFRPTRCASSFAELPHRESRYLNQQTTLGSLLP